MKPVVSCKEMKALEKEAISLGTSEEELMEQAARGISEYILTHYKHKEILLVTGKGNNGGDAFTVGRNLLQAGCLVSCYSVIDTDEGTLAHKKRSEFTKGRGTYISSLPDHFTGVVVDGIFGTGFSGKLPKEALFAIKTINHLKTTVIAIDIPSGLNSDTGEADVAISATHTLTIGYPKIGFFIGSGWNYVGHIHTVPISIREPITKLHLLEMQDVQKLIPPIVRNRHKYQAGHVVGISGSHGMVGAAMMAAWAALKTGAGIVHLAIPENALSECAGLPWEVVRVGYKKNDFEKVKELVQKAGSCFVGPGLADTSILDALWKILEDKVIIDAEAITWLANKKKSLGKLPHAILTPHLGEMQRLLKTKESLSLRLLELCQRFVDTHQTNLVLKGGPTFLFSHDTAVVIMTRGDPGMATAGSGDVLTGILAALRAEGLDPQAAMQLGTFLHGLAGELAADSETSYSMTATSLISHLPGAFHKLGIS